MIFKIYDGRTEFYQWDLDRKIIVSDPTIDEVHFCNKTGDCALVVEVYEEDGLRLANVPNIALQSDLPIYVYGYCGGSYTKNCASFKVRTRNRPADYIYTETIVKEVFVQTLEGNEEDKAPSVAAVNDALEGKVDKITDAYRAYTTNKDGELNPVKVVTSPTSGAIPIYFGTSLRTGTPLADGDAANKQYVDDGLVGKVDAVTKSGKWVYTSEEGVQVTRKITSTPTAWCVPWFDGQGRLNTNEPVEDSNAANKKYVDDGLSKKLDALTNGDSNSAWLYGNDYKGEYKLFKTSPHGKSGHIVSYGDVTKTGTVKPAGTIGVNMPEQPYQAAPKQYVDDGLAGKFSLPSKLGAWSLLGIGNYNAETGEYTPHRFPRDWYGSGNATIAAFAIATDETLWTGKNPRYTLGVPDPIYPIQVANKQYVDGKVSELEHGMMNALGTQYITVEVKDFGAAIVIPSGAMKFAYIESLGVIKGYDDDGNELGVAEVHAINVGDTEYSIDDLPKYIEIPEGTQVISLSVTPPEGTVYTKCVGGKIVFQVKVGA